VRLYVIARHAESTLNIKRRVNGDPSVDVPLTEDGREEARQLGIQVANVPLDLCVHTRFGRTRDTAAIALAGRDVPVVVEPLLDDIDVGDLEGRSIDDYRAWKRAHSRADSFPGGESLDDAARRYARGFQALLARSEERVLVVCHEIPLRYALNAAGGSDDFDGPVHELRNATPYLFDEPALERAAARIEELVMRARGLEPPGASRPNGT
jgi:broad specificity phosphatase PhoE